MREVSFEGKTYRISFDAMDDRLKQRLSPSDLNEYLKLLQVCQLKPRAVYKEVKAFCHKHPEVPEVINLLTFAHIQNRRIAEAEKLIEETYHNHPDYLFAKINYADQCIRKKKFGEMAKIFESFDLSTLYPEKEIFHTSEFRGFMIMMAYYRIAEQKPHLALPYFEMAKEIEPHHPNVVHLEKKLFKRPRFKRLLAKLFALFHR